MPPPKRGENGDRRRKGMMSVYLPFRVAYALGDYRSKPFMQGIRIAAHLISEATVAVASKFTAEEWNLIADSLEREIDPEHGNPGRAITEQLFAAHRYYSLGKRLGKDAESKVQRLAERLEALSYIEAWAVIIACQFRRHFGDQLQGDRREWWDLGVRREILAARKEQLGIDEE